MARTQIDLESQSLDQSLVTSKIKDGAVNDSKIATGANIAISKLNTTSADFDSSGVLKVGVIDDSKISSSAAISTSKLADGANFIKKDGSVAFTANQSMGGYRLTGLAAGVNSGDAVNKSQLDAVTSTVKNMEWQPSVLSVATTPPSTPSTGDRYLINGTGQGDWTGHDNQIAEWNGSSWVYTTPTVGTFVSADNESSKLYLFGGSGWDTKYFESTTASTGLTKVGFDIRVDATLAGSGLTFDSGIMSVGAGTGIIVNPDNIAVDVGTSANKIIQLDSNAKLPAVDGSQLTNINAATLDSLDSTDFLKSSANSSVNSGYTLSINSGASLSIASGATFNLGGVAVTATASQLNNLGTIVVRENPGGTIDGSNTNFTLANTPKSGTEEVYLNGLLQDPTNDYTISSNTITFLSAPKVGDRIRVSYRY